MKTGGGSKNEWFWNAVDFKPQRGSLEVQGANVNFFSWSEEGPGLFFVHGHNAHAGWWDFIAPFFKSQYKVVASDLSGMGDSDHRDAYNCATYVEELVKVAEKNELGSETVIVAHSFGGMLAIKAVAAFPERFKGLILLDSGVKHPDDIRQFDPPRLGRQKLYPSVDVAVSRFRLQPPQHCENSFILDYIARNSIEYLDDGFAWKFDDEHLQRMAPFEGLEEDFTNLKTKCALIYGENSKSFSKKSAEHMLGLLPTLEVSELKDSQHHLFLDQPQKFIELLTGTLSSW